MKPLPPVVERSFIDSEIEEVKSALNDNGKMEVLRLYRSAQAFAFTSTINLAARNSKYINCSKIFAANKLFEILCFVQCTVKVVDTSDVQKHWLVKCSPFMSHQCKPWYGYPTEVWSSVLEDDYKYFTLDRIQSRVVYTEANVNFGRVMGHDNVLVVIPIPLYT